MTNPFALNWLASERATSLVLSTDPDEWSGNAGDPYERAFGLANVLPAFGGELENRPEFEGPIAVVPYAMDARMHAQGARFSVRQTPPVEG